MGTPGAHGDEGRVEDRRVRPAPDDHHVIGARPAAELTHDRVGDLVGRVRTRDALDDPGHVPDVAEPLPRARIRRTPVDEGRAPGQRQERDGDDAFGRAVDQRFDAEKEGEGKEAGDEEGPRPPDLEFVLVRQIGGGVGSAKDCHGIRGWGVTPPRHIPHLGRFRLRVPS